MLELRCQTGDGDAGRVQCQCADRAAHKRWADRLVDEPCSPSPVSSITSSAVRPSIDGRTTPGYDALVTGKPTLMDIFAGAGGLSLGLEQAGFEPALAIDSDERAMAAHAANFPASRTLTADVARVPGDGLLDHAGLESCDLVAGGPPCQAFSYAGKRRGGDPRGLLPLEFARLVSEVGPRYFVMENVPGILLPEFAGLRHGFRERMRRAGYAVSDPWLLDASQFGVAQRRLRVFVVGARTGLPLPEPPFPIGSPPPTSRDAIGDLEALDLGEVVPRKAHSRYARLLAGDASDPDDRSIPRRAPTLVTGCARTAHSPEVRERFAATKPGAREPISRFGKLHPERPAFAVRAGTASANGGHTAARPIHYRFARCITVREAARLQSLPDWFTVDSTVWRGHMQVGNAVPPLLARAVGRAIQEAMDGV